MVSGCRDQTFIVAFCLYHLCFWVPGLSRTKSRIYEAKGKIKQKQKQIKSEQQKQNKTKQERVCIVPQVVMYLAGPAFPQLSRVLLCMYYIICSGILDLSSRRNTENTSTLSFWYQKSRENFKSYLEIHTRPLYQTFCMWSCVFFKVSCICSIKELLCSFLYAHPQGLSVSA